MNYNELQDIFNSVKQHTISKYPQHEQEIQKTRLNVLYSGKPKILANTRFLGKNAGYEITMFPKAVDSLISQGLMTKETQKQDVFNIFLHEFTHVVHIIRHPEIINIGRHDHDINFKRIGTHLGLKNPARSFIPTSTTLFRLAVPSQNSVTGRVYNRYYYATQEWLDENPSYKKYVIRQARER